MSEKTEQLKNKAPNPVSFSVNRMSQKGFDMFQSLANDMFAGDYGMTIQFLVMREDVRAEFYDRFEEMDQKIGELENKLKYLMQNIRDSEEDENQNEPDTLG